RSSNSQGFTLNPRGLPGEAVYRGLCRLSGPNFSRGGAMPCMLCAVNQSPTLKDLPRAAIVELLTAEGLKPTAQRLRIAELLLGAPTHMSAEQILETLRSRGERVSKATVYNTLKALAGRGLLRQIHVDPECAVYDS